MGLVAKRTNQVMEELDLPPPDVLVVKRGWKLNQSPLVNNLISHAYVMKHL